MTNPNIIKTTSLCLGSQCPKALDNISRLEQTMTEARNTVYGHDATLLGGIMMPDPNLLDEETHDLLEEKMADISFRFDCGIISDQEASEEMIIFFNSTPGVLKAVAETADIIDSLEKRELSELALNTRLIQTDCPGSVRMKAAGIVVNICGLDIDKIDEMSPNYSNDPYPIRTTSVVVRKAI